MIYLNGEWMPIEKAMVPVLDRGFIFGDGVYEVIPCYSGHPFRLREHLTRLQSSLDGVRIDNPYSLARWDELVREMVVKNPMDDQYVYLQVTRGVAPRDHAFPKGAKPTVFIMSNPLTTPPQEQRERGVAAVSAADNRWLRCDIKSVSLLANCLLRQVAVDASAAEVVLLRDGRLTEGSASNIFLVRNGVIITPPKTNFILPGITYDVVIELARANRLPLEIRQVSETEVRDADELWLTSSTKEVLSISTLDGIPVGHGSAAGKPGPVAAQMHQLYQDYKRTVMRAPVKA
ncbi:MAG: D-amino acid aminotransferase [Betaproteobacteria bacterium]|nr:MAG: D-amino acid aminotransferase [Betaproteobacteria bacterium]